MRIVWLLLAALWTACELVLRAVSRRRQRSAHAGTAITDSVLWQVIGSSLAIALFLKAWHFAPVPGPAEYRHAAALLLFAVGLALRLYAVVTLGRFFTTRVATFADHDLVLIGPYRWMRHPAYSGLLLAFAGAGLGMGDALAFFALIIPVTLIVLLRIDGEERVLHARFGRRYEDYALGTDKLIPRVY